MPTAVPCSDEVILQMNLKMDISAGAVTNTPDGSGFQSTIDATAGGAFAPDPTSFTYAKFGPNGLEKVGISDEDSLTSMDWDIAFRRYVIRINSGNSGPSCVSAARVPTQDGAYEDITTEPADLSYHQDDYFTDSCMLIPDGSGLPNSPATALSSYWSYPGCVAMTHYPFVIKLADGRRIKFIVDDYYSPDVQTMCDSTGMIPMTNPGSANFQVRWEQIP
jgi:HmuY protein